MNVLVVETDASFVRSIEFALAMRGHLAVIADTPEVAVRLATEDFYRLIVIGPLGVATASGTYPAVQQLCRDLRHLPGYERSSILVAISREEPHAIIDALDAGANGYLNRPIDAAQLRLRIEDAELLAGPALPVETPSTVSAPAPGEEFSMLALAADLALVLDPTGRVVRVVHKSPLVLATREIPLVGYTLYALCHPDDAGHALDFLNRTLDDPAGSPPQQTELRFLHEDGTWRAMDVSATNRSDDPAIGGIAFVARDITQRRLAEQEIRRQALYDPLTSLPNRALFFSYLEHAFARADRRAEPVVVMFMDIDNFALVNVNHGRAVGDAVLGHIGERLRTTLRATDTAARMGDDEFTILLEDVAHIDEAQVVASRMTTALREPFEIEGLSVSVTASIGVAFSHPSSRLPHVPSDIRLGDLLRQADAALYRAKSSGKDRWVLYDGTISRRPSVLPSKADLTRSY